jgi:integrase
VARATCIGRAPKTVNSELSVLRQLLKHAKLWYRFTDDHRPLKNTKPPAGQALTDTEQAHLVQVAKSNQAWFFAYVAATLDFFCGLRACEIKGLQWKHVFWAERRLSIRRSKTPASWRDPSLNDTCLEALRELHARAARLGFAQPDHFLCPWHGQRKQLDPTRPMTGWRSAWRSLRKAAGLPHVRFHDGRHTALTRLAEKGVPDWDIRAQFGHVSPAMMAVYSQVRKALDEAAKALEPEAVPAPQAPNPLMSDEGVMSHVTRDHVTRRNKVIEFPKESGGPSRTRTCDLLVRRLMQVSYLVGSSWVSLGRDRVVSRCLGADCSLIVHCKADRRLSTAKNIRSLNMPDKVSPSALIDFRKPQRIVDRSLKHRVHLGVEPEAEARPLRLVPKCEVAPRASQRAVVRVRRLGGPPKCGGPLGQGSDFLGAAVTRPFDEMPLTLK